MRNLYRIGLLGLLIAMLSVTASAAVILVNVYLDENGNGSFQGSNGDHGVLPYIIGQDPGPGGQASVLMYSLSVGLVQGDVGLIEPGPGGVSDYIRFNQGNIAFYSDNSDGVDALADGPLPTQFYTNLVTIPEVGAEGSNGAVYIPIAGQPGYYTSDFTMVYNITSDSPEPGSLLLVGLGLAGLAGKFTFRKKTV